MVFFSRIASPNYSRRTWSTQQTYELQTSRRHSARLSFALNALYLGLNITARSLEDFETSPRLVGITRSTSLEGSLET